MSDMPIPDEYPNSWLIFCKAKAKAKAKAHQTTPILPHCNEPATYHIPRRNPANPRKHAQRLEDIPGEEIPRERAQEREQEESLAADSATVTHSGVHLGVQRVEERAVDEIGGPD